MSNPTLVSSLGDWAAAISALPAAGPLPQRTVLVPSERHAHALRRELVRRGDSRALAGTRFLAPVAAAAAVLEGAGVPFTSGEDGLRAARIVADLAESPPLEHFDLELLRSTPGWGDAFADAIRDLEAAGLAPRDLPDGNPLLRDLALLWSRADAGAGTSRTTARVCSEAAALLRREAGAWPFGGPTLAVATGHETAAVARFLTAIPGVTLALRVVRPLRAHDLDRVRTLFGPAAADALATPPGHPAPVTERDLLATYLFERPQVLASAARPRSSGPDGTFQLEEHAGVESEVEAAADWVARKVMEGIPLEELAVLVAARDPLAQLVAARVERLEVAGAPVPVYVAGGVPATSTSAGARVLAALRAVSAYLSAESLAPVLPALRLEHGEKAHLTHGEAMELAYSLGTVGGNAANAAGALSWSERATSRVGELEAALYRARSDEDSAAREIRRLERTLGNLVAVRPALDALVGVARVVVAGAPLAAVWETFGGFVARWLLAPGEGAALVARLGEAMSAPCAGTLGRTLKGFDALGLVEQRLLSTRAPRGRFGDPAVYVGSVASAAGLEFRAVRVLGLCEGVLPSLPRESPVLPERARAAIEGGGAPGLVLPRARDRVSYQVHALFTALCGAREEVVLSAPRVDAARTEREASAIFIEAASAVARPNAATGERAAPVPSTAAIGRDYFAPARAAASRFRAANPVGELAWLVRAASADPVLPPSWSARTAYDLARVAALRAPSGPLGPIDGVLGAGGPFPDLPGLAPSRPISASALQQLLQCPRMFLMRRVLGWDDPAAAPLLRELDPLSFGSLLHRVVEEFYRAHGEAFVAGKKTLAQWKRIAFATAERAFDEFLSEYPLVGERVRDKERERLRDALDTFLAYDWDGPAERRFVGVELGFGQEAPLAVAADGVTLQLHGFIDRVDVEDGVTVVRDLKSGKPHPRRGDEVDPTPLRDVQLGVYTIAAKKLASSWKAPRKVVAAYAYASGQRDVEERAFRDDAAALEHATAEWLATAAHILDERAFCSTPDKGDCEYCAFEPLCRTHAAARAAEGLEGAGGALGRFRALKLGEEDEG